VPPAELRSSPIAGRGLFATELIPAGTVVLRQDGIGELNHSCEPNLGWSSADTLVAVSDIAEGEELTLDYATRITDPDFAMMCHCETYRCRQVIEGTDWRIPQLQQRYAGRWAPAVQQMIDGAVDRPG
jgi:SET domain-containing protein